MINDFSTGLDNLCNALGIEEHDRNRLKQFGRDCVPQQIAEQVDRVNDELLSSYLVWDSIKQEFRLYRRGGSRD